MAGIFVALGILSLPWELALPVPPVLPELDGQANTKKCVTRTAEPLRC